MLIMCARHTVMGARKIGFVVDNSLGDRGKFFYPNEHFISRVLGMIDTTSLNTADPEYKKIILNLRRKPIQTKIEKVRDIPLKINYNLILPTIS